MSWGKIIHFSKINMGKSCKKSLEIHIFAVVRLESVPKIISMQFKDWIKLFYNYKSNLIRKCKKGLGYI